MAPPRVRSYFKEVLKPLFAVSKKNSDFHLEFMGFVNNGESIYPLYFLSISGRGDKSVGKDVLISAGIHGEEPAGVYALMAFLEHHISNFLGGYRFLVFPCINPFGFEHGYRFNPDGVDLNRQFKPDTNCFETQKVLQVLSKVSRKFLCTIDLHETDPDWADEGFTPADNPRAFYLWEVASDKNIRIGDKVADTVQKIAPICDWPKIYGDTSNKGVIWYPEGCGNPVYAQGTTLEAYLSANYTPQSFTLETPCGLGMNSRVSAHLTAIRTILELKRSA